MDDSAETSSSEPRNESGSCWSGHLQKQVRDHRRRYATLRLEAPRRISLYLRNAALPDQSLLQQARNPAHADAQTAKCQERSRTDEATEHIFVKFDVNREWRVGHLRRTRSAQKSRPLGRSSNRLQHNLETQKWSRSSSGARRRDADWGPARQCTRDSGAEEIYNSK